VIEVNPLLWWFVLNGPILTFRPPKVAKVYEQVWMKETDESPLRYYTRQQAALLQERLPDVVVDWAMRYGNPSIESRIHALKEQGCTKIAVIPLYPQYAAATTATVCDKVFEVLSKMRHQPALRTAAPYEAHPLYIKALADSLKAHLATLDFEPQKIILSFHGIPKDYFDKGDPYHCYCHKTARLLREATGYDKDTMMLCFQSRFGPREWLQPYLDKTLEAMPSEGTQRVVVMSPGFAADCIETLEEIAIAGKESFLHAGGTHFSYVPALNDAPAHLDLLEALARENLQGW
jgi:ferrochelatase